MLQRLAAELLGAVYIGPSLALCPCRGARIYGGRGCAGMAQIAFTVAACLRIVYVSYVLQLRPAVTIRQYGAAV